MQRKARELYAALNGDTRAAKREAEKHFSDQWVRLWRQEHGYGYRIAQEVPTARIKAAENKYAMARAYRNYKRATDKYQIKPRNKYNVDESGAQFNMTKKRIFIKKQKRRAQRKVPNWRASMTIVGTSRAEGPNNVPQFNALPIGYYHAGFLTGSTLPCGISVRGFPKGTKSTSNKIGYMDIKTFGEYLEHFDQNTRGDCGEREDGTQEWRMLVLDGHKTHVQQSHMDWALERRILIFVLPSHSSDRTQPCDRANFKVFKAEIKKRTKKWMHDHGGAEPNWLCLGELLAEPYQMAFTQEVNAQGWKMAGLHPFDPVRVVPEWEQLKNPMCEITAEMLEPDEWDLEGGAEDCDAEENDDSDSEDEDRLPRGLAQQQQKQMVAQWSADDRQWDFIFKIPDENSKLEQELRDELKVSAKRLNEGGMALDEEEGGVFLAAQATTREALAGIKGAKQQQRLNQREERAGAAERKKQEVADRRSQKQLARQEELEAALPDPRSPTKGGGSRWRRVRVQAQATEGGGPGAAAE